MAAPRPSQSAEAARAAALQAEFNEKRWVWVPDEKEGYLAGWVHQEDNETGEIVMSAGGEIRRVPLYALSKMNPPKFDRVDDIADLTFLNEASVVHNLRLRYGSGAIYTYSGLFLVAINPYQHLPLYTDAIIQQYRNKRRDENPPHIFAVAERAWVNMGEERENQSILITGESGAGKTESTKKVIQYLSAIATDAHPPASSHSQSPSVSSTYASIPATGLPRSNSFRNRTTVVPASGSGSSLTAKGRLGLLERQIIQANPILEAFGNAQTQRNNNSSRFGKFIRISFAPDGSISGANIDWYLLEKSRVVVRSSAERNFHVFYQLMSGGGSLRGKYSLSLKKTFAHLCIDALLLDSGVEDYEFLNKSRREVDGVNDRDDWDALISALDVVGFTQAEQFDLFRIVAAILHIGNIVITATKADDAVMPDPSQAERVCHLLGIPVAEFTRAVLRPRVLAGREWVTQARTRQQALDELAALSKTLYEKSFGALVDRINRALDRPSSKSTFIGVLDIAGFEIFDINTYEQLLINFTNEKLQQFFNHHMFVLEQEEYTREGIEWDYVNFKLDLQPTIDLIETSGNPIGILSCLDEECIMPKATDLTFTEKVNAMWKGELRPGEHPHPGRTKYSLPKFEQGFIIKHYAGYVEYRTDGWLEKNKDPLNDNLTRVLASSSEHYVSSLFEDHSNLLSDVTLPSGTAGRKRGMKKGAFRTVAQRHREQLSLLMAQLQATQPHFVRCIVPNVNKKPGRVDVPLVLDQLRCNGVLEGIRIARLGYPNRLPFVEFRQRYEILTPGIIPRGYMDGRKACLRMVEALQLDNEIFKVGTSKIFFKAGVLAELEERRDTLLFDVFSRLQAVARKYSARRQMKKILNRAVAIRTIQRNARVYGDLKEWPWWQLYTKVRPLLAATRNDEELRRKEVELQLVKERAERDQRERETLQNVKMALEAEKRRVEEDLEAERALALDKDALLERSKHREAELEEEIVALHADLDVLDSQLDRALKLQKEGDEKHETLRVAFDQAAEHLVRLESEQQEWRSKETALSELLASVQDEMTQLQDQRDELQKLNEEFASVVSQREEDLARVKERSELSVNDLQLKFDAELRNRQAQLEDNARHTKDQLGELTRTATEYSNMIQKKEEAITQVASDLTISKRDRAQLQKQTLELQALIDRQKAEIDASKADSDRTMAAKAKLQEELDDLRALMETKTSEESRRMEVEKSKEEELADLRRQVGDLQNVLNELRRAALDNESKLKVELDKIGRQHAQLEGAHGSLLQRERSTKERATKAEAAIADLEKTKRALESEVQALRARQIDGDGQLAEALKSLQRQLSQSQAKCDGFEDTVLQLERDAQAHERQLEASRRQLESESAKCKQLQQVISHQKGELAQSKDRLAKFDAELNKALTDLKNREWDVKQLESRQDRTIVEHVHVLEKAKRVTDQQLKDAHEELQKNAVYIRSLEQAKKALARDLEDFTRETKLEQVGLRAAEKVVKVQEEKATRALSAAETERKAKEAAELHCRRLQVELNDARGELETTQHNLTVAQRSKENLESELARLVDDIEPPQTNIKSQRQFEARIAELEEQLRENKTTESMAARIRGHVDRQHQEIRNLIMKDCPKGDAFRNRLMRELQIADEALQRELLAHPRQELAKGINGAGPPSTQPTARRQSAAAPLPDPRPQQPDGSNPDPQTTALKQQVQVLELRIAASDRIRQHLEGLIHDLTADLESSDESKQSLQSYRQRLSQENSRLAALLQDEANARRASESAQIDGVQAVWDRFQNTIAEERNAYARLDDSRKALLAQQRNSQVELEEVRTRLRDLSQSKKQVENELADLQDRLEAESVDKGEALSANRELTAKVQELQITSAAAIAMQSELQEAIETYKEKTQVDTRRLEEAEIARAKSTRAEAFARRALADLEKAHADLLADKTMTIDRLEATEKKLRDLEVKIEEEGRESSELGIHRHRLTEQLQDERKQHQKDLAERDFAGDQTRKKYQAELAQLSEELQSQRDTMSRLREDNRKIRSDYDELQLRFDDEVYSGGAWKKEKERMETKISDLTKAYETSTTAQSDQQAQIVSLHSQVRELRSVLNDAEADRAMLQKARRSLQAELEGIKLDHVDANKMSSDRELQKLQLKKQDLERSLEEQEDRVAMAFDRMKKAEAHAGESQAELDQIRVENSELDRKNAYLEKQVKDLNVRIVDLETRSYSNTPQPTATVRQLQAYVDELTEQLNQRPNERDSGRLRSSDKAVRDVQTQLAESDRQRIRLEQERKSHEAQIQALRQQLDKAQTEESNLQLEKRRAEREAGDYKQQTLNLGREVERLRNRLSRPPSSIGDAGSSFGGSTIGSPRKVDS
ncbi:nonmuscle myosin heavy chain b [Leucogyrophana mollusca]|uniref:Nonmuscle myosin heavy chain b n=1 Tax=Leucogyrophana mollusca TaxID=85980 RepID=A0ACB8B2E0_9AGAM|nr:nonmuscle myosin heavy chain b [Leucogyrophana mollusca]